MNEEIKISSIVENIAFGFENIKLEIDNELSNSSDIYVKTYAAKASSELQMLQLYFLGLANRLQEIEDLARILENPSDIVKNRLQNKEK